MLNSRMRKSLAQAVGQRGAALSRQSAFMCWTGRLRGHCRRRHPDLGHDQPHPPALPIPIGWMHAQFGVAQLTKSLPHLFMAPPTGRLPEITPMAGAECNYSVGLKTTPNGTLDARPLSRVEHRKESRHFWLKLKFARHCVISKFQ